MRKYFLLIFILAYLSCINAIEETAGTAGFTFLKMQQSARAAALGSAYTALSNDGGAVFYNPAGLVQLNSREVSASYLNYIDGVNCGSVIYGHPLSSKTALGIFFQFLTTREDRTLADPAGNYLGTEGTFGISNLLAAISFSRYLNEMLNVGFNLKYIRESLDTNSASALAFDLAILHQTTNDKLKVGLALKNIGRQISYHSDGKFEERLPATAALGFKYQLSEKIIVLLDIIKPFDFGYNGHFGLEYRLLDNFLLRAGYDTNAGDWRSGGDTDFLSGLTAGLGFSWKTYSLDYALVSYGDLGLANYITLKYRI